MRKCSVLSQLNTNDLPPEVRETIIRLISVVAGSGKDLPAEMPDEIAAIFIDGVDPQWQIAQMKHNLDLWAPRH